MSNKKYKGPEKRKSFRLATACSVKYLKLSAKTLKYIDALITKTSSGNISTAGIKLITHEAIPLGTLIELQFKIPKTTNVITCIGKIVRVKARPRAKSYDVGLVFVWIRQRNVNLLDGYVRTKRLRKISKKFKEYR